MFFHYYDEEYISLFGEYTNYSLQEDQRLDITRISVFLDDVKYFLWRLVRHKPAFIEELYDDVVNAWQSAKQRFEVAKQIIATRLGQGTDQFISQLQEFGLLGSELKLKLRNIEHQFGNLISMNSENPLKIIFDSINNLLDSVLGFLGIHNALKEIKDAIRDALA